LLDAFAIPRAILPEVRDTGADFGSTEPGLFGRPLPIAGVAGDQQAALIGQACFRPGMVKSTYGTGAFALVNTGAAAPRSQHRLVTTVAYRLAGEAAYALEGSIFVAGAAVQWLRDRLGLIGAAAECDARAAVLGLTAECGRAELARAVLEAVGYQTRDLIEAMQADSGLPVAALRVDGGMAASGLAMQFLADILPARVERPASLETTAWGAAYVAGLMRGLCPPPAEMTAHWQAARVFAPAMDAAEREAR